MTRDAIIALVRAKIDEINSQNDLSEIGDIFKVIDQNLEDSANDLLRKAPLWLCQAHEVPLAGQQNHDNTTGSGTITLPDDFLRLHSFKMKDWDYTVTDVISEENPLYKFQKNTYLKGRPWRPVVAVVNAYPDPIDKATIKTVLEYHTTLTIGGEVDKAFYVKRHDLALNNVSTMPDALVEGLAWQAAANFYITTQQPEQAQAALGKLQEFITLNTK